MNASIDVLTTIGDFGKLALEVDDVRFEVITLPHLDGEKIMVVPLSFLERCVPCEKYFGHILEVVERMWM